MKRLITFVFLILLLPISNVQAFNFMDFKKNLEKATEKATEEIKKQLEQPKENTDIENKEEKATINNKNENSLSKYEVPWDPRDQEFMIINWINNYENLTTENTKGRIRYSLKNFENQSLAIQKALRKN